MSQLEFELYIDENETKLQRQIAELKIDLEIVEQKYDNLRKSFFSRFHALEKIIQENISDICLLKRENEALKINIINQ